MSEIQVTTTDLFGGSNTLNVTAVELGKVQVHLGAIIDAAGDAYDGQLRHALEDIIGPGVHAGGRLQNRAEELGRELSDRAMGFEEANVAGQSAISNASTAYINYIESTPTLGFISIIKNKLQSIGQSIWNVAGLTLGGLMSLFFVRSQPSIPSSFVLSPQPGSTPSPEATIDKNKGISEEDKQKAVKKIKETISSLNVTENSKYLPRDGKTFCNIFVMDFSKKMDIPLPEYLDWDKDGRVDDYLNANESLSWLDGSYNKGGVQTGLQLGWQKVSPDQAVKFANEGKVVIVGWQNPVASEPGHVAVVRPESTADNIRIAQAGATNFEQGSVEQGFGNRNVSYFVYNQ